MRHRPPEPLVALLARLQLVGEVEWNSLESNVRNLAADVPVFESVWIDALRQARVLTQFQAKAIHAGRGDALLVDRFVLCDRSECCFYAHSYRARPLDDDADVQLTVFPLAGRNRVEVAEALRQLAARHAKLPPDATAAVRHVGTTDEIAWVAGPWTRGLSAAQWMLRRGRFTPPDVLEIARAMVVDLATMERAGLCHGDISAHSLIVQHDGQLALPQAGVRGLVRPSEGFAHLDIRPEACDGLAPERVADGLPPSTASDLFACGCLWWHLLCGRGAFGSGDSLSRLKSAHDARVGSVRQWASDVPEPLSEAIAACTRPNPAERPASFAQLEELLGPATRRGQERIAAAIARRGGAARLSPAARRRRQRRLSTGQVATAASLLALAVVAFAWPIWVAMTRPRAIVAVTTGHVDPGKPAAIGAKGSSSASSSTFQAVATRPVNDSAVAQAGYFEPPAAAAAQPLSPSAADIVINSAKTVSWRDIPLRPGSTVSGLKGQRLEILVPRQGWKITCERTCFVNVDFVFEPAPSNQSSDEIAKQPAACFLDLRADQIEFEGCTFHGSDRHSSAIIWRPPAAGQDSPLALPSGRLRLKNVVFTQLSAGVVVARPGAATIEISNSVYLSGGPCLQLTHAPASDEPVHIVLYAFTLRDTAGLMALRFPSPAAAGGEISVDATSCVFAGRPGTPLVALEVNSAPDQILRSLKWTGQGSLLATNAPFAAWNGPDGQLQPVDDSAASVAGLVRDNVQFAGPASGGIPACRVVGWQAPLQSPDAPGAIVEHLPGANLAEQSDKKNYARFQRFEAIRVGVGWAERSESHHEKR